MRDQKKLQLEIKVRDEVSAQRIVPQEIGGVPVRSTQAPPEENIHYDDHYDGGRCDRDIVNCIEGGNYVCTRKGDSDFGDDCDNRYGFLTATGAVEKGGDVYVMTSAHGFWDNGYCYENIDDLAMFQGSPCSQDDSYLVGSVEHWDDSQDFALVEPRSSSEFSVSSGVVDSDWQISSHVTEDGVDKLISNAERVYKQGSRTCKSSGTVVGYLEEYRCGTTDDWIAVTTEAAAGDSGAPHYRKVGNSSRKSLSILGAHTRHNYSGDDHELSFFTPSFRIYEENNIIFKPISC